jgi:hypothetical protein
LNKKITKFEENGNASAALIAAQTTEIINLKADMAKRPTSAASAWSTFNYDKQKSSTPDVAIGISKVTREMKEQESKLNSITLSGLPEGKDKKDDDDTIDDVIEVLEIDKTNIKSKTRLRKKQGETKPGLVLVEFKEKSDQTTALANSRKLKDVDAYSKVYVNRDLTINEMEVERLLRIERNLRNSKLPEVDGEANGRPLRYGRDGERRFYWGIRFGVLQKIDKANKRILR